MPSEPSDQDRHLTELELATRWRVGLRTLQRWRRAGRAPRHLLLGRAPIFPLLWVREFEAAHKLDPDARK